MKGIYKAPPFYPLLGEVSISLPFFDKLYERPQNLYTFLDVKGGASDSTQAALERDLANFPDAKVETRGAWIDAQDKDFDNFLLLLSRPARAGRDREPRRHDQHARPERLRAHP